MKTTKEPTTPAPVWRLLEPGEIIREGDEYWHPVKGWRSPVWGNNGRPVETEQPIRRRMEPDPVKAELLAALETLISVTTSPSNQLEHLKRTSANAAVFFHVQELRANAIKRARAAIARATS